MNYKFPQLDLSQLKTQTLTGRDSKVSRENFARPLKAGSSLARFFAGLPNILAGADLKEAAGRLVRAIRNRRPVVMALGGHVVKVGLGPVIVDLMERGLLDLIAVNGSVMVHDAEVALVGATSEDVGATLGGGAFGVTRETAELINGAARLAHKREIGLGRALGLGLRGLKPPFAADSLFASASRLNLPVTVHLALGADVYSIHPSVDGAALGASGQRDFQTFCGAVASLEGGVFINAGSAVIIPEVFLKAVTLARNLGYPLNDLTTINLDFIRHYRPQVNVVSRPTAEGGRGFYFIGHHEIMLPLLWGLALEQLEAGPASSGDRAGLSE